MIKRNSGTSIHSDYVSVEEMSLPNSVSDCSVEFESQPKVAFEDISYNTLEDFKAIQEWQQRRRENSRTSSIDSSEITPRIHHRVRELPWR